MGYSVPTIVGSSPVTEPYRRFFAELIKAKPLLVALVSRQLTSRYRGSILGFLWTFLNPLFLIATYSLVFKYYIRFEEVGNYTLFLFAGLLPWIWFSSALLEASTSISSGGSLVTKAVFPLQVLPVVAVASTAANFVFSLPMLLLYMIFSGVVIPASILAVVFVVALQVAVLFGMCILVAAVNVVYRDVQHILGNFINLWFFLCPILYPLKVIPELLQFTVYLNPAAVLILMYQQVIVDGVLPSISLVGLSLFYAGALTALGIRVFNRYREQFAELV